MQCLANLKNLAYLWLDLNAIRVIPSDIAELDSLSYLNLDYNAIRELPLEVRSSIPIVLSPDSEPGESLFDTMKWSNPKRWRKLELESLFCTMNWSNPKRWRKPELGSHVES